MLMIDVSASFGRNHAAHVVLQSAYGSVAGLTAIADGHVSLAVLRSAYNSAIVGQ